RRAILDLLCQGRARGISGRHRFADLAMPFFIDGIECVLQTGRREDDDRPRLGARGACHAERKSGQGLEECSPSHVTLRVPLQVVFRLRPSAAQAPISGVPIWPRRYSRCPMRCLSPLTRSVAAAGRVEWEQPSDGECSATDARILRGGVMVRGITAAALIASVVIGIGLTAPAFAKHGNGNGGGHGRGCSASFSGGYPSGFTMGQRSGWNGGSTPPGSSHGNKTGWGGRGTPPGPYKKYYSNSNRG